MAQKLFMFIVLFLSLGIFAQAQDIWTLEKCLEYAEANNIQLQQAKLAIDNSALDEKLAKFSRYPNLNGNSGASYNFGRAVDPFDNSVSLASFVAQNYGLNTSVTIYNGMVLKNQLEQSRINVEANQYDLTQSKYDLGLNIAQAYLSVLLAEEQLRIAQNRIAQTNVQLDRTKKLINAGALARSAQVDIETQIAGDEQSIISAENAVEGTYLLLKTSMNLDPSTEIKIEEPTSLSEGTIDLDNQTVEDIFNQAVKNQAGFKANELRIQSAEKGVDIAKGALHPSLTAFAGANTQYANLTLDKDFKPPASAFIIEESPVFIDGVPATLGVPGFDRETEIPIRPYMKQLNDNLSYSVGLNLNVPIFNGYQGKIGIERAKLNLLNTQLTNDQTKQVLRNNIQQALTDAKAAKRQLQAAEKTLTSTKASYVNAEKRFNAGASGIFEYTAAKNAVDAAEINKSLLKYDYIFKLKIIDYYLGNSLTNE